MISIIVAIAQNGAIGYKGDLIYHLSADLKRFKELTTGNTVIMGRKTYESLPKGALPNRRNIVLTRQKVTFPGTEVYSSLDEALSHCSQQEKVYIMGGAQVYTQALELADELEITLVHDTPTLADTFFPNFESDRNWKLISRQDHEPDQKNQFPYSFLTYTRQ